MPTAVVATASAGVQERDCKFVGVVVHDGRRAVYADTVVKAPMGGLTGELAFVTGKATEVLHGMHQAQQAVRMRVGAVWEYPELGVDRHAIKLLGATTRPGKKGSGGTSTAWYELQLGRPLEELEAVLARCHAERSQTEREEQVFPSLSIRDPEEVRALCGDGQDAATIANIVRGEISALVPVAPTRLHVPQVIRTAEMQRNDTSFQSGVDTGWETKRSRAKPLDEI